MIKSEYPSVAIESDKFTSSATVTLLNRTQSALAPSEFSNEQWQDLNSTTTLAGQAGRTCYSRRVITPLDYLSGSDSSREVTNSVAKSTLSSGHSSTREHIYYEFGFQGVSRLVSQSVFHPHPHYTSDQQSQRYVSMDRSGLMFPELDHPEANTRLQEAGLKLIQGYNQLTELLTPIARQFYLERFPLRNTESWESKVQSEAQKRAQEVARYLLPVGIKTNFVHTVNELTLLRYYRLSQVYETNPEAKGVIEAMVKAVAAVDPSIMEELTKPLDHEDTPEFAYLLKDTSTSSYTLSDEFDTELAGKPVLIDTNSLLGADTRLANAVRLTLNLSRSDLSNEAALDLVLNPKNNRLLASTLGEVTMHQLSQTLNQVQLQAAVRLSWIIDTQLQRHRGFAHTRPINLPLPRLDQDIAVPLLLRYCPEALDLYLRLHQENIQVMEALLAAGATPAEVTYLNTNATIVRKMISGPLGSFYHFFRLRTCLTAQEEIYNIARELIYQLHAANPVLGSYFEKTSPCGVRNAAGVKPFCPEGDRYCGVTIWERKVTDYPDRDI